MGSFKMKCGLFEFVKNDVIFLTFCVYSFYRKRKTKMVKRKRKKKRKRKRKIG